MLTIDTLRAVRADLESFPHKTLTSLRQRPVHCIQVRMRPERMGTVLSHLKHHGWDAVAYENLRLIRVFGRLPVRDDRGYLLAVAQEARRIHLSEPAVCRMPCSDAITAAFVMVDPLLYGIGTMGTEITPTEVAVVRRHAFPWSLCTGIDHGPWRLLIEGGPADINRWDAPTTANL